jgi:hypothetical protein
MRIIANRFYPEEFRKKTDSEKYKAKGICEVSIEIQGLELDIKNITYRIDHEGKIHLKPPFRIHSNKKAGIKPKLVPSIVFRNGEIWPEIESYIRKELITLKLPEPIREKSMQLDFLDEIFQSDPHRFRFNPNHLTMGLCRYPIAA